MYLKTINSELGLVSLGVYRVFRILYVSLCLYLSSSSIKFWGPPEYSSMPHCYCRRLFLRPSSSSTKRGGPAEYSSMYCRRLFLRPSSSSTKRGGPPAEYSSMPNCYCWLLFLRPFASSRASSASNLSRPWFALSKYIFWKNRYGRVIAEIGATISHGES